MIVKNGTDFFSLLEAVSVQGVNSTKTYSFTELHLYRCSLLLERLFILQHTHLWKIGYVSHICFSFDSISP